jgi:hypothetical protein
VINDIIRRLIDRGPLLGRELLESLGPVDQFELWRSCFTFDTLQISSFARYYLRYDISRAEYIRLSPSIIRDFLTYTIVALPHQRSDLHRRHLILCNQHRDISLSKVRIVTELFREIEGRLSDASRRSICAFVAGDIAYFMGHAEQRPSVSGKIMSGSDIDIIIVHTKDAAAEDLKLIDQSLTMRKAQLLKHPDYRQELDFIIKPIERVAQQVGYETIDDKIASKIIFESLLIWGSSDVYLRLKDLLDTSGASDKIRADFLVAIEERTQAINAILSSKEQIMSGNTKSLFYATQERVEFS